jgi:hypothetical protein
VIVNKLEGKTKKEQNNEKLEDFKNRLLKEFREKQFEGFEKRYDNMYETLKVNTNPFNDISYEKIMGPSQIDDKSIDEIKDLIKNITDEKVLFKTLELYKNKYPEEAEK